MSSSSLLNSPVSQIKGVKFKAAVMNFRLPGEESDIEGMEVIAEDGKNLKVEAVEEEEERLTSSAERASEKGRNTS